MKLVKLTSENEDIWSQYLVSNSRSLFFHTIEWKNIVEKVYGFKPLYFMALDSDKVVGVLPAFFTNSVIFGCKIVTTPFNFYNGPIYDSQFACHLLLRNLNQIGQLLNVRYIEYKNLNKINKVSYQKLGMTDNLHYLISGLDIDNNNYRHLYSARLRKNIRTLKRKFDKHNFFLRQIKDINGLTDFYDIMVRSLRIKHNMIPQPLKLFKELFKINKKDISTRLYGAYDSDLKLIGGVFSIFFQNQATYAWGASDINYSKFSPSTLLIDNLIKICSEDGFQKLDFGVTSPAHNSLLNFKKSWGCQTIQLPYFCKLITDNTGPSMDYHTSFVNIRKPYELLPDSLIKYLSPMLVKHLN